jgi:AcrR family transcriptional regulator
MCGRLSQMNAPSIRARVRAEMTDEIKAIARRHLATDSANLSLRAVARDLGVVSSAIYRYFPSRDELLTALILDAYNALGAAVEKAEGGVDRADLAGRWMAVCHAVRDWGLANPHEYALIYGSPVPGYRAPQDTVPAAIRTVTVLGRILQDGIVRGLLDPSDSEVPAAAAAEVKRVRDVLAPDVPIDLMARGMGAWMQLFGCLSFELFGQLNDTIEDRRAFFDNLMRGQAAYLGLS